MKAMKIKEVKAETFGRIHENTADTSSHLIPIPVLPFRNRTLIFFFFSDGHLLKLHS